MKITISMIDLTNNKSVDIQVDNQQRIKTTLKVLGGNVRGFSPFQHYKEVRIKSSGRRILTDTTYEEAQVYTGAEIILEEKSQELLAASKERGESDGE